MRVLFIIVMLWAVVLFVGFFGGLIWEKVMMLQPHEPIRAPGDSIYVQIQSVALELRQGRNGEPGI